jgi:Holliday junction resolvase RusA-like endonuclease
MTGGLDPYPSLAHLREQYRERTGRELVLEGDPRPFPAPAPSPTLPPARQVKAVTVGLDGEARRVEAQLLDGGGLHLVIPYPPRTKKNGTTLGIRQTEAYRRYRDFIIAMMQPLLGPLGLPLHPMPLNLCALYYVDRKGERADLIGLHQGLCDALENAEVLVNDRWVYALDGSRIIRGDPAPRIDVTITPLASPPLPAAA